MTQHTGGFSLGRRVFAPRNTQYIWRSLPLLVLTLVVLLASAELWGPGIVNTRGGGDSPFLLQRLHQMVANLRAGVFPVRWMPDAAFGLGYPFFNHYSALPFYLASSLDLLGLDPLTALKLTQTLGFLIAALAMYGCVNRLWGNRAAAWLAAVAYTVAPFHLVNVYVRGDSLSEFYAFVFYPLILWAVARVIQKISEPGKLWIVAVVVLALAYAGLVLSHNISAFIFSPFVSLLLILLAWEKAGTARNEASSSYHWGKARRMIKPLALGLVGLLLGMALAAWAWLPALLELDYVQAENLTGDYFDFANHFRAANLVQPSLWFDYSIEVSIGGRSPFAMSAPQALVALVGLFALLGAFRARGRGDEDKARIKQGEASVAVGRATSVFVISGLLLATVMITPLSRPLWEHLPLLPQVQFPWRFLSVQALFAALASAALVLYFKGRWAWALSGVIAVLLVLSSLLPLSPERLLIGPEDVTSARLQEYELFTSNIGTTVRYEWLPEAVDPRPFTFDAVIEPTVVPAPILLSGTLVEATQTRSRPTEQIWHVRGGDTGATLAFPLLYWPNWSAWVDDEPAPVRAIEGSGYLAMDLPAGEHTVRLALGRTSLRTRAELLSLMALLVVLVVGVRQVRSARRNTRHAAHSTQHAAIFLPSLLILLIGLLIFAAQSSPPPNRVDDLTMDFAAMPYLHHNPEGIRFSDPGTDADGHSVRLLSYSLSANQFRPGDTLIVNLTWDDERLSGGDRRVTLRLVSPAEHFLANRISSYTLAEDSGPLEPTTVHRLAVPENTARGVYLLQLSLWGSDGELLASTPAGSDRGSLYLRPVRVTEGAPLASDAPLLALVGPDIRLHAARLEPGPEATEITAHTEWSTVRRLASNYGVSVRLLDPKGEPRVARDTQPGYGFSPTSLWRPGKRVADRYVLSVPNDLPPGEGYWIAIVFYQVSSRAEIARAELGPFTLPLDTPVSFEPRPRAFELPLLAHPVDVDFTGPIGSPSGDHIRLAGYDLMMDVGGLELTLWWVAERQPQINYTVFVHLFDPAASTAILTQSDSMPRRGSYPTSVWLAGEVVDDVIRLSLADVPAGRYRLAVGLFDAATGDRLAAMDSGGTPLPDGRLILPDVIEASGQ